MSFGLPSESECLGSSINLHLHAEKQADHFPNEPWEISIADAYNACDMNMETINNRMTSMHS